MKLRCQVLENESSIGESGDGRTVRPPTSPRRHDLPQTTSVPSKSMEVGVAGWIRWPGLRPVLATAVGCVLMGLVLSQVSFGELSTVLLRADLPYLLCGFFAGLLTTPLRTVRLACAASVRGAYLPLYGVVAFVRMANYVLPFRMGEFMFLYILKRRAYVSAVTQAIPLWGLLRAADFIALSGCFCAVAIAAVTATVEGAYLQWIAQILLVFSAALLIAMLLLPRIVLRCPLRESDGWVSRRLKSLREGVVHLRSPWRTLVIVALGLPVWLSLITFFVLTAAAFGAGLALPQLVIATMLVIAIQSLPIRAPLAIGTGDAAWVGALALMGLPVSSAAAIALGIRLVQMLLVFLDGAVGYVILLAVPAKRGSGAFIWE